MPYVRLERGSDWGEIYLALPGKRLDARGYASARTQGLAFGEGALEHVRFPDGHIEQVTVRHKKHRVDVGDHGHSNAVESDVPGFRVEHHGLSFWVALDEVDVFVPEDP